LNSALCDYFFTFSLSDLVDRIKKNHAPLSNVERGAAGLISRLELLEWRNYSRLTPIS